ncbi:MAG: shikimate dehydrogenase [Nitrosopumilales archaeon]|nr:shikimate dehydrogenase [Nitrosopumilales archaeon]
MSKTYAVIGDPIDHSLSPNIHNAAFRHSKLDHTYIAYKIPAGELAAGIEALKAIKIAGFNVTIPHKIEMMKFLDEMDTTCKVIGAVNTVLNENGKLKGYNTDMIGFLDPIKKKNFTIKNSQVLLLGAGGAARAIITAMIKEKASKISIVNRTQENANKLADFAKKIGGNVDTISIQEANKLITDYKFIINSTSIGMRNEPSPISTENIGKNSIVYDIVYQPINTDLIKKSKENGATIIYGYEMLLSQAACSFEIWHKMEAPYDAMKNALLGGI